MHDRVQVLEKNKASEPLEAPVRTVVKRIQVNTAAQRMQVGSAVSEYRATAVEKLQPSCVQNHTVQARKKILAPK